MKIKIWEKDDYFHPLNDCRIDMDPSVVKLPEGRPIPLSWGYDYPSVPLGRVDGVRLEDGEIFGNVTIFDGNRELEIGELLGNKLARFGGYYTDVIRDPKHTVASCELNGVSLIHCVDTPNYKKED